MLNGPKSFVEEAAASRAFGLLSPKGTTPVLQEQLLLATVIWMLCLAALVRLSKSCTWTSLLLFVIASLRFPGLRLTTSLVLPRRPGGNSTGPSTLLPGKSRDVLRWPVFLGAYN
ncbi:hypothetical protein K7X08_011768 [Anisodus acutangulus]|uniref:Uncharacterized protein n=1 Tax=Anisodus acutangulus TaxID=402998 RepID=A0A9Q1MQN7_9SOLA|nr:hypothetical protein K7X08_011768 [Anisodus acutangulus]